MTTAIASGDGSSRGPDQSSPIQIGRWNSRHRSSQPGSTNRETPAEERPQPCLAFGVRVDHELALPLLEALGVKVEQQRRRLLERFGRHRERDAPELAQRNALFSFSKNPSSRRYVSSPDSRSIVSRSSRCSSLS
jgi:hypothetical protein